MTDHGPHPFVTDIEAVTLGNNAFRSTLWTGKHLQLTVMCLQPEEEIGLEVHHDIDQFIRVEGGRGQVVMGPTREDLSFTRDIADDDVVLIPGTTKRSADAVPRHPRTVSVARRSGERGEDAVERRRGAHHG
jgi:mannose-6-phosphate isomerase-like protein (cupin superfamily)